MTVHHEGKGRIVKRLVEITMQVEVQTDDSKFTDQFMEEFRADFFPFHDMNDHAKHIAQLAAREVAEFSVHVPTEFVEGYGPIGEMGISVESVSMEMEVLATRAAEEGGAA